MDYKRIILCGCIAGLLLVGNPLFAQLKLGDNLGSHKATKDLEMNSHNIKAANLVNASGILVGTATALSNTSIALQVDGVDKAILVPRVTDLLNATTPSIPVANAINGMIVYDLASGKFYYRQNNAWVVYVDAVNYVDRFIPQLILGKKTFKSDSGFVAKGTFSSGVIPDFGAGTRMMFYPGKSAFRVGTTGATQWEDGVTGNYSIAMGDNNMASGISAVAIGSHVSATGNYSSALGSNITSGGIGTFTLGDNSTPLISNTVDNRFVARYAGGYRFYTSADTTKGFYAIPAGILKYKADYSAVYDDRSLVDRGYLINNYALKANYVDRYAQQLVLGQKTFKSDSGFVAQGTFGSGIIPVAGAGTRMMFYPGKSAFRVGATGATQWEDAVIGNYSIAMGNNNTASGINAVAIGSTVSATGNYSFAIGSNVAAAGAGSFIVGDNSSPAISNAVDNRFVSRYAGGYRFFTSADTTKGFYAIPAGVLKYKADYSTSYDDRSLVDRGYVLNNYALKTNYVDRYVQQVVLGQKTFKSDSGFVAQGTFGSGLIPATGVGTRLLWYPRKAAFRAGYVSGTQWDDVNVANYSVAIGNSNTASGVGAISLGTTNTATAIGAVAIGTTANTTGNYAMGIGNTITSSGIGSVAIGNTAIASANYAVALGRNVTASAIGSSAIGNYVSSSTFGGALILGDNSTTTVTTNTFANQFMARYAGGYRFFTSADTTKGFFAIPAGVLKYKGDYSGAYDDRSIVDKAYLDLHFAAKSSNAVGPAPSATGINSFAIGEGTTASGLNSFAYGSSSQATNNESFAGGYLSVSSGLHAVGLGRSVSSSGTASIALGDVAVASGNGAVAIGSNVTANGANSTAMGRYAATNGYVGAFVIGDASAASAVLANANNSMTMRFEGGYRLFSSSNYNFGVQLPLGGTSWSALSDKRKKENFENIDAESFLTRIDTMQIGSWNYKKQDSKKFRHYGPMAQDFYGAFGKDSYGTIGCDTLIASADFDGVNMIAIKGLVTRTNDLNKENTHLKARMASLESTNQTIVAALIEKNETLTKKLAQQESVTLKMELALAKLQQMMEEMALAKTEASERVTLAVSDAPGENRKSNK